MQLHQQSRFSTICESTSSTACEPLLFWCPLPSRFSIWVGQSRLDWARVSQPTDVAPVALLQQCEDGAWSEHACGGSARPPLFYNLQQHTFISKILTQLSTSSSRYEIKKSNMAFWANLQQAQAIANIWWLMWYLLRDSTWCQQWIYNRVPASVLVNVWSLVPHSCAHAQIVMVDTAYERGAHALSGKLGISMSAY